MKNILITGGAGFIGRYLAKVLSDEYNIHVYDLQFGMDIRNLHDLDKAFETTQCDTVIHLAALVGVRRGNDHMKDYMTTNIEGTWNIGKMCEKYNCRLISFSSSSVYGNAQPPTSEDAPKNPLSFYGMTKLMGEHIVNRLNCPTVIIRPFTVYGEDGRADQVFYKWLNQYKAGKPATVFTGSINKNGLGKRGYTYIGDIVNFIKTLVASTWELNAAYHEDFNLGGEEIITTGDIIKIYKALIPNMEFVLLPRPDIDVLENYANISKAKTYFNFSAPPNFKLNIQRIIRKELNINE